MKALKIIGIIVGSLIVLIVVSLAFMSPQGHLERSVVINAEPAAIYQQVNNYKNFNSWSPWAALDPNTKYVYEGPDAGSGAKMSWVSENKNVGTGSQWIIESEENKRVKGGMNFGDFEGNYTYEVALEPTEGGTKVTWHYDSDVSKASMSGAAAGKFFGLFMDGMLGPSYEQGLANLKKLAESLPEPKTPADTTASQTTQLN